MLNRRGFLQSLAAAIGIAVVDPLPSLAMVKAVEANLASQVPEAVTRYFSPAACAIIYPAWNREARKRGVPEPAAIRFAPFRPGWGQVMTKDPAVIEAIEAYRQTRDRWTISIFSQQEFVAELRGEAPPPYVRDLELKYLATGRL